MPVLLVTKLVYIHWYQAVFSKNEAGKAHLYPTQDAYSATGEAAVQVVRIHHIAVWWHTLQYFGK